MTREKIFADLHALAEPEYAAFSAALKPGARPLLGVRLPALRTLARHYAAEDADTAISLLAAPAWFEEEMLRCLIAAYAHGSATQRRARLEAVLPTMTGWSSCDSTAATCKFMAKEPAFWQPWLEELARRDDEFAARFGLVCLLDHFVETPQGRRAILQSCADAPCTAPYARLAVAWVVSIVAVKEPTLGLTFLEHDKLDGPTHNKAIQKFCESRRAAPADREKAKSLRW